MGIAREVFGTLLGEGVGISAAEEEALSGPIWVLLLPLSRCVPISQHIWPTRMSFL